MPELLWARGGYDGTIVGLGGGVCRKFCGLRGGYGGTFVGSGGGMQELLGA